jgi:hypothetical protein
MYECFGSKIEAAASAAVSKTDIVHVARSYSAFMQDKKPCIMQGFLAAELWLQRFSRCAEIPAGQSPQLPD